ncbi:ATP-binding cassette domain-containing protein [Mucilaginibacter lappiensis]|uniref:ABC-type bacteriocin/lantibiotic exporter with double-glycine peptidase domain n=1 Tax=Mucilaginibacter lappiensis TaxID=354630 RepID=A0A841JAP7_9SPHI|nr:ABC transporter ATP-binding protein [Mucilaginibacter lappiensis]MBB6127744.1 ABC-type bacteriocin/lantibiotic exporter with double-glycine peptidase domain [Mucilaginibacter lappiensis]
MEHIIKSILTLLNRQEKKQLGKLILLDLLISALDIAFLGMLLLVIGIYTSTKAINTSLAFLHSNWLNKSSLLLISIFLVLFSVKNWIGYLIMRFQHHFFYGVASRLSKKNIINYLKSDYLNFVNVDSSIHIRQISQQPIEFSHYILTNVQQVISQIILILFSICAILIYQPVLFLLLLLLLLPPVILLAYFIRKRSKQIRVNTKQASEKTIQHLQESLAGFVESNIYNKSNFFTNRYHNYQQQLNDNLAGQQTLQALPSRLVEIFAVFGFFILVLINKYWTDTPVIDLLTIGVFMAAAYKIIPGIIKILNSTGQIKTYEFTLNDLLKAETSPKSSPKERTSHNDLFSSLSLAEGRGEAITSMKFNDISFRYKDHQILKNSYFNIDKGDLAGISAVSGRGKTTLINLLLGFLAPDAGNILINDQVTDITTRKRYWNRIAYVKQQGYFIHDTILKNITLSDEESDHEKLAEPIAICGLNPLLNGNAEGLHQVLRENGKNLSGGQRQRILLARALYHDFDVLILDEPFGEMDQRAEEAILIQLQRLASAGKMILFITHNTASLSYCNKLITLE